MFNYRLFRLLIIFTLLSVALGLASALSPKVAALGWIIGTLISIMGGYFAGRLAIGQRQAAASGALVGSLSIAIGCLLAFLIRAMPLEGVIAATVVGLVSGCGAGVLAHMIDRRSVRAAAHQ